MFANMSKSKHHDEKKIDTKHNLYRIKNDLLWIYKDSKTPEINSLLSLYWLDINLKNALFPWTLKIERELKSLFISFYKDVFQTDSFSFLIDKLNYLENPLYKKKIAFTIDKITQLSYKRNNVDNLIFSMSFGEFVTLIIVFSNEIQKCYCKHLKMKKSIFLNLIKYCSIIRNLVAHNKTILNIIDDINYKKFSLKKNMFSFQITKEEIDIISTNIAGIIYAFRYFIKHIDSDKVRKFNNIIWKQFKIFNKFLSSNNEYKFIMKKFFLNYEYQIIEHSKIFFLYSFFV